MPPLSTVVIEPTVQTFRRSNHRINKESDKNLPNAPHICCSSHLCLALVQAGASTYILDRKLVEDMELKGAHPKFNM